jgi:t-SNARE complex subunit (syntaxin)
MGFDMPSSEKTIATSRYLPSHETSTGNQPHELKSPPLIDISTMAAFFEQVDHIKTEIAAVKSNVAGIQSLHESALAAINNSQTRTFASQLVTLKAKTQKQNHNIKKQIQCK